MRGERIVLSVPKLSPSGLILLRALRSNALLETTYLHIVSLFLIFSGVPISLLTLIFPLLLMPEQLKTLRSLLMHPLHKLPKQVVPVYLAHHLLRRNTRMTKKTRTMSPSSTASILVNRLPYPSRPLNKNLLVTLSRPFSKSHRANASS